MTTFSAVQRIVISDIDGDLTIHGWEQQTISVASNEDITRLRQQGDTLIVSDCDGPVELSVPFETLIVAKDIDGDVTIKGVRQIELRDVGNNATLRNIRGTVVLGDIGQNVTLSEVGAAVQVKDVGHDATLLGIGGNVMLGDIGGSVSLSDIDGSVQLKDIGNNAVLTNIHGNVMLGDIGRDASLRSISGTLALRDIGGDVALSEMGGNVEGNDIGGDLQLLANFSLPGSRVRLRVGGDAFVTIPENANLSIQATVGGEVRGHPVLSGSQRLRGNKLKLVYGDGSHSMALLDLKVGGDLTLQGNGSPQGTESSASSRSDFDRDMSNLGRELEQMGHELSREIVTSVNEATASIGSDIAHAMKDARRAEKQAHRTSEHAARINVRIHDREWRLDPDRIERIVEQARRAASEGVQGALEAVEQALRNLHMPIPPVAPVVPVPPVEPVEPVTPFSRQPDDEADEEEDSEGPMMQQEQPVSAEQVEQQTISGDAAALATPVATSSTLDVEQERVAILRMIAEGRITPDEGDLLLEALGE